MGISEPRRGRPLSATDSFLLERDPGSACRHGPSRAIAVMGRHEPPRVISLRACRGLRGAEEKGQPRWRRAPEFWAEDETSASWSTAAATGAASGDQGARGERPQLPLQRSIRHSTNLPPSRTGVSRELCGPSRGTELFSGAG